MKQVFNITREVRPEAEKRVFDRKNAVVKDGNFICNICLKPLTKDNLSRQFKTTQINGYE